jgi:hypothetical protein
MPCRRLFAMALASSNRVSTVPQWIGARRGGMLGWRHQLAVEMNKRNAMSSVDHREDGMQAPEGRPDWNRVEPRRVPVADG